MTTSVWYFKPSLGSRVFRVVELMAPDSPAVPKRADDFWEVVRPMPFNRMSNGFSFESLLAMWMAAYLFPLATGLKVILKVVLSPGARVISVRDFTWKLFLSPVVVILRPVRLVFPVFQMV